MKLDFPPRFSERIGAISLHAVQKIYELDSGKSPEFHGGHRTIRAFDHDELASIFKDLAIVIPIKNERLKLLEGVLSGIPHDCMTIIVSNSPRQPVDRYKIVKEALQQFNRFANKNALILHQRDEGLAETLREVEYNDLLGFDNLVRNGKAEGMVLGMLLAK